MFCSISGFQSYLYPSKCPDMLVVYALPYMSEIPQLRPDHRPRFTFHGFIPRCFGMSSLHVRFCSHFATPALRLTSPDTPPRDHCSSAVRVTRRIAKIALLCVSSSDATKCRKRRCHHLPLSINKKDYSTSSSSVSLPLLRPRRENPVCRK